jgi:Ni/Fe-hydrogenase subunit HybB-like protein
MSVSEDDTVMVNRFVAFEGHGRRFTLLLFGCATLVAFGLYAAHYMEQSGHHVTGMSNQVVWGLPHVFAVFLIVAASGALNVASMSSVFSKTIYRPFARLSVLVAVSLLIGGLLILVLDLGRPDRLVVALTHYNFKSIFAWNIFLYSGFLVVALFYLWTLMEGRLQRRSRLMGRLALLWRLALTTGTGCIFGFLIARPMYNVVVMVPLFIVASLSFGLASFLLIFFFVERLWGRLSEKALIERLARLLAVFIWIVLGLVATQHVVSFYSTSGRDVTRFVLIEGGVYTGLFWLGQMTLGAIVPLMLLRRCVRNATRGALILAAALVVIGGFVQLYVLIIASQVYPLTLFSNKVIIESTFFDGVVASYFPSLPELTLGMGGVALALACILVGLRVLRLLPEPLLGERASAEN